MMVSDYFFQFVKTRWIVQRVKDQVTPPKPGHTWPPWLRIMLVQFKSARGKLR